MRRAPARAEAGQSPAGGPAIRVSNLRKSFVRRQGEVIVPVDDISFSVDPGEFVVLLGPSGCGKTTLLRCIAGLEHPDGGEIDLGGRTVFSAERRIVLPPERRSASVVFQSYALWPHLTVFKNVAYPLRKQRLGQDEVRGRVLRILGMVGVGQLAEQYPGQLSGGQQQRVALARALVAGNDVVLFDEPLSNVDAKVRDQLRIELLTMQKDLGFAALYVTHDQTEAMELGHRIAVLRDGKVQQLAPPREVYRRPANPYVASFVGRTNELPGKVVAQTGASVNVQTALGLVQGEASVALGPGTEVCAVVRPESIHRSTGQQTGATNEWRGTVGTVVFGGPQVRIDVIVGDLVLELWEASGNDVPDEGTEIEICFAPEHCWVLALEADPEGELAITSSTAAVDDGELTRAIR